MIDFFKEVMQLAIKHNVSAKIVSQILEIASQGEPPSIIKPLGIGDLIGAGAKVKHGKGNEKSYLVIDEGAKMATGKAKRDVIKKCVEHEVLNADEAAELLGVTKRKLYRMIDDNRVVGKKCGREYRFLRSNVEKCANKNKNGVKRIHVSPKARRERLENAAKALFGIVGVKNVFDHRVRKIIGISQIDFQRLRENFRGYYLKNGNMVDVVKVSGGKQGPGFKYKLQYVK